MFDTIQDLQEFILWCRDQQIKAVQVGETKVEFSDYAFLEKVSQFSEAVEKRELADQNEAEKRDLAAEDEDLLFWSTNR